ncbi:transient receptor potential cation channel subfamily M member 2-like [Saccostrea echinata]|uniref:transient receptor potential cation channel subfamily M member 2-like n=1 Tax=Saccostrea echinata TaxID=191078 RepID=UPI002A812EE1|nr:transient receptor potential cation channel subfamily M member 2-like [Saccostrea echinata]
MDQSDMNDTSGKIWEPLVKEFGTPKLVLSVIGDSDSFVPRAWPKSVFQTALIETHKSSGGDTWILYGNKNVGVSKIVRDAKDVYTTMEKSKTKKGNDIILIGTSSTDSTEKGQIQIEDQEKLSPNSAVMNLSNLLELEEFVQKQMVSIFTSLTTEEHIPGFVMHIPIVIILLEGDVDDIKHVAEAVHKNVPVIVIKGSGKAADIILDFLKSEDNLRSQAALLFGLKFDDNHFDELEKNLKKLRERPWMVSEFDTEHDDPLMFPKLVGEAVVRGWALEEVHETPALPEKGDLYGISSYESAKVPAEVPNGSLIKENGYLCSENKHDKPVVSWSLEAHKDEVTKDKKVTIAEKLLTSFGTEGYIVDSKYTSPPSLPLYFYVGYQVLQEHNLLMECGHILLLEALKSNRTDYVKVLMDHGVSVKKKDMPVLYRSTISCTKHGPKVKDCNCLGMMWLMKSINKEEAKNCFKDKKVVKALQAPQTICRELLDYQKKQYTCQKIKPEENKGEIQESQTAHLEDILLWALYANRPEIAETVWLRGQNQLMTGLVCYETLRKLSDEASDVKEQNFSKDLLEHAQMFYKRSLELLDSMFETDSKKTLKVLEDSVSIWGITSNPLTFAYENFMYEFVAKPASQKNLNKTWYGGQAPHLIPCIKSVPNHPGKVLTSPLSKYVFNYFLFLTMLISYSAFVTTSISTTYYVRDIARIFEYYVYFWGFGDLLEEFFSCFTAIEGKSYRSYTTIVKRYLNNFWNQVDILSYVLLITALFVRHMHPSETFTISRRMFSLSLLIMYLRFLEAFLMIRTLGPTLIMIKEMLKDLFGFIILLFVVILGVGFYYHANLWPDHVYFWEGRWTDWRIWKVIYYPYWQLYGETFNDFLEGPCAEDCTITNFTVSSHGSEDRCPQEDWTVGAVSALYMLFSNLLLVNLVIAMFSSTYERVTANAENLWRFERYTVIMNYKYRVPSPVNLLYTIYRVYRCIKRGSCRNSCCCCCFDYREPSKTGEWITTIVFLKQKVNGYVMD